jgi:hypothetical protein
MAKPDPYAGWSLTDRFQLLAFEAELAHLPRSLIAAVWEVIDTLAGHAGRAGRTSLPSPSFSSSKRLPAISTSVPVDP